MNKKNLIKTLLPISTIAFIGGVCASSLVLTSCSQDKDSPLQITVTSGTQATTGSGPVTIQGTYVESGATVTTLKTYGKDKAKFSAVTLGDENTFTTTLPTTDEGTFVLQLINETTKSISNKVSITVSSSATIQINLTTSTLGTAGTDLLIAGTITTAGYTLTPDLYICGKDANKFSDFAYSPAGYNTQTAFTAKIRGDLTRNGGIFVFQLKDERTDVEVISTPINFTQGVLTAYTDNTSGRYNTDLNVSVAYNSNFFTADNVQVAASSSYIFASFEVGKDVITGTIPAGTAIGVYTLQLCSNGQKVFSNPISININGDSSAGTDWIGRSAGTVSIETNGDNHTAIITGFSDFGATNLVIPNFISFSDTTYTITSIDAEAFQNCTNLANSITLPTTLTSIGNKAFNGCSTLRGSLIIPNSVTSIGSEAFKNCTGLNDSLTISSSLTTTGADAFLGDNGVTEIILNGFNYSQIKNYKWSNTTFSNWGDSGSVYVTGSENFTTGQALDLLTGAGLPENWQASR